MGRLIAIRHRVKKTAAGEARPTELYVINGDVPPVSLELDTETDELDWVKGKYPVSFRATLPNDDLATVSAHHITWRRLRDGEKPEDFAQNLLKQEKGDWFVASKVPSGYEGLKPDDTVVMILGGSGDALASAISRMGETINARAFRTPAIHLKELQLEQPKAAAEEEDADQEEAPKKSKNDGQAMSLVKLFGEHPERFYQVLLPDRNMILLTGRFHARMEAMLQRIKCEQRIFARTIGTIFAAPEGQFPEGTVEQCFEDLKKNDPILAALLKEETRLKAELERALEELPIYTKILQNVEGLGPSICARIISAVQDIRRFTRIAGFKAYCGVHVLADGSFPRQRHGEVANWHPDPRQAFYLTGDQFNRRPGTEWGQKLLENKRRLREKHPAPIVTKSRLASVYRRIERLALLWKLDISREDFEVETLDGLYGYWRGVLTCLKDTAFDDPDVIGAIEESLETLGKKKAKDSSIQLYTPGHIHKMAMWRTATRFAEWLYRQWRALEAQQTPEAEIKS